MGMPSAQTITGVKTFENDKNKGPERIDADSTVEY